MLTLIKNARVYAPQELGKGDVLICADKIARIAKHIELDAAALEVDVIDAKNALLVPGFVDTLVHITGGGGEGGFATRTPELTVHEVARSGVTTLVGALGTDATTRSLDELYGKTMALNADGVSCYMYTGSYEIPVKTLTGDVKKDVIFIAPVIGVGEIAIADHRGSQASVAELARLGAQARVAGLIAGKKGIVMVHVGEGKERLDLLHKVAANSETPLTQFYPTHINRNAELLKAGIAFAKQGGYIDFTASTTEKLLEHGELRATDALEEALRAGAPADKMTLSSDAQGSLPHFDHKGQLDGLEIGSLSSLLQSLAYSQLSAQLPLPVVLAALTRNPADAVGLYNKGRIEAGADADLNIIDPASFALISTMARGRWILRDQQLALKTVFDHSESR